MDFWDSPCKFDLALTNIEWATKMATAWKDNGYGDLTYPNGLSCSAIALMLQSDDGPALSKNIVQKRVQRRRRRGHTAEPTQYTQKRLKVIDKEITKYAVRSTDWTDRISDVLDQLQPFALPPVKTVKPNSGFSTCELVVHLTDMHYGALVSDSLLRGINSFNGDVCIARMDLFANRVAEEVAKQAKLGVIVTRIVVAVGGDLTHNELMRNSAKYTMDEMFTDQIVIAARLVEMFVLKMALLADKVDVYWIPGNHGRMQDKNDTVLFVNSDIMIGELVKSLLARRSLTEGRVNLHVVKSPYLPFKVAGWTFCLDHGHAAKGYGNPQSILKKRAETIQRQELALGNIIHYFLFGHYHSRGCFETTVGYGYSAGSIIGTDEYAFNKGLQGVPSQNVFVVTQEEGVVQEIPIRLGSITAENAPKGLNSLYKDDNTASLYYHYEGSLLRSRS